MGRIYLLIFSLLSACVWSGSTAQAQPRLFGCFRAQFETYSEAKKRPAIKYLDAARELADKSVKLFVEGRISKLYSGLSPAVKEEHSEKDFRERVAEWARPVGKVFGYEYRDQYFTYADIQNIDLRQGWATTRYAARTSGWDGTVIIEVSTSQQEATPQLLGIEILRADANTPVDKIFLKPTGEGGPWVRGPLTINPTK